MARERKITARKGPTMSAPAAQSSDVSLASTQLPEDHRAQLLMLVRALARDAARADHAAERDSD
ncbi:hypothetical protein C5F48_20085 [Cereibacter changlensis JA139]|uniref:Uncharacterized protein n=2 Tax=Cereibacter changlensis TaxID=402884 RepID=A0A2T4JPW9_9RHOB|nr:hypothetical protein [Cereibacter changlensis]PTE19970.1 hypothetical protein C5F48_20085 [Cereibacter changlensis JA139]PZX46876.1 hypothetical protein LX76_04605 [Cereibacter changlensis]